MGRREWNEECGEVDGAGLGVGDHSPCSLSKNDEFWLLERRGAVLGLGSKEGEEGFKPDGTVND